MGKACNLQSRDCGFETPLWIQRLLKPKIFKNTQRLINNIIRLHGESKASLSLVQTYIERAGKGGFVWAFMVASLGAGIDVSLHV